MQDKEKLKKLVDIFAELLKIKGNEWLIDAVLEKIKKVSTLEEIAKHSVIKEIHEYCVEEIIKKQAEDFYKDFLLDGIKQQLIMDFIKMEHQRRRDDFESFCLSAYQQIENITNFLHNIILEQWDSNKDMIAFTYFDKVEKEEKKLKVRAIIFNNQEKENWDAKNKFKSVVYFFYFTKRGFKSLISFNEVIKIFIELYQIRNSNHRGVPPYQNQQEIRDRIFNNQSKYYLKFYGFLEDLVRVITENLKSVSNQQQE